MKQIHACRAWLDTELETVHPELIVYFGATAAQSLLGARFRVLRQHGEVQKPEALPPILATFGTPASEPAERERIS